VRRADRLFLLVQLLRAKRIATAEELYRNPKHPYTQALLSAVPQPDPRRKSSRVILTGDVPSPSNLPSGCFFHPRCPKAFEPCPDIHPVLGDDGTGHSTRCLLWPESVPAGTTVNPPAASEATA